jgi:hypothetical protein
MPPQGKFFGEGCPPAMVLFCLTLGSLTFAIVRVVEAVL